MFTVYLKRCAQALYIGCVVAATKSFETMWETMLGLY